MSDLDTIASLIVDDIIDDLTDRRGLRHEWNRIDHEIRNQIIVAWVRLVKLRLDAGKAGGA